jgi:hypothetical protein
MTGFAVPRSHLADTQTTTLRHPYAISAWTRMHHDTTAA